MLLYLHGLKAVGASEMDQVLHILYLRDVMMQVNLKRAASGCVEFAIGSSRSVGRRLAVDYHCF